MAVAAHKQKKLIKKMYSKSNWGMDLSLEDLALISATYPSAQQYGPKFEKWINNQFGWTRLKAKADRGDSLTLSGKYIEQKWCIRTDTGPTGLQHRFWQEIDYYLYGHVDDTDSENITVDLYLLTKAQVLEEAEKLNLIVSHGTPTAILLNEHVEYTMGVRYGSDDHQRWKKLYQIQLTDLENL